MIDRRRIVLLGAAGLGALATGCVADASPRTAHDGKGEEEKGEEEVTPAEDLMREHGALNRILLVYDESVRRLEAPGQPSPTSAVGAAAAIIRRFIEDYHEKLEEDFLFPRFEKANKLTALVATLRRQHLAGRRLTAEIQRLVGPATGDDAEAKTKLVAALRAFTRMYRPHEAREDTVLFPALHAVIPHKELEELGERFEEKEHQLFGKEGFEGVVVEVARLEESLGIAELDQFTP